jgi:negative regulator of replication initiation
VGSGPDDASRDNEGAALAAYAQASTNSVRRTTADDLAADKTQRLIEWNVEVLLRLLKQVEAKRQAKQIHNAPEPLDEKAVLLGQIEGKTVIDEVKEIVNLPRYKARDAIEQQDADSVELSSNVVSQLRDYVTNIAALYNSNPFHNFEHASHVTMSVTKLLSRIIAPADVQYDENHGATGKALHDHTYGITSDPLTQFACVFSALIHDGKRISAHNLTRRDPTDPRARRNSRSIEILR